MLDTIELKGYWFFPGNLEKKFAGILNFKPDQPIRLHLNTNILVEDVAMINNSQNITIWGYSLQREPVTLFRCVVIGSQASSFGVESIDISVGSIIKGFHLHDADVKIFSSARVSYSGLENWMSIYGHSIKGHNNNEYTIEYKKPSDIAFTISDQAYGALSFWNNRPYFPGAEITLQQDNFLRLNFTSPVSYNEVNKYAWKFQQFITLLMWQKTIIKWFFLEIAIQGASKLYPQEEIIPIEAQVFYRQNSFGRTEDDNYDYLLKFNTVNASIETMILKWYQLHEEIEPIIDILYANIGVSNEYVRNYFLNMVQAVEAYHRRKIQNTARLKEENKPRVKRILDSIEEKNDKNWLKERLSFSYEPSLRNRLKDLFTDYSKDIFINVDSTNKAIDALIKLIVNKRNYFTHYDPSLQEKEFDVEKLMQCVDVLKMLLSVLLLKDIDVPGGSLASAIPQRRKFRFPSPPEE